MKVNKYLKYGLAVLLPTIALIIISMINKVQLTWLGILSTIGIISAVLFLVNTILLKKSLLEKSIMGLGFGFVLKFVLYFAIYSYSAVDITVVNLIIISLYAGMLSMVGVLIYNLIDELK